MSLIYFLIMIILSLLLFKTPDILAVILFLFGVFGWIKVFSRQNKIQYLVGALVGFLGEIMCVYLNIWKYTYSGAFFVPIWLPFAWGNAIVFVNWIAKNIEKKIL